MWFRWRVMRYLLSVRSGNLCLRTLFRHTLDLRRSEEISPNQRQSEEVRQSTMRKLLRLFFSPNGRINRKIYGLRCICVYVIAVGSYLLGVVSEGMFGGAIYVTSTLIFFAMAYSFSCLSIQRLHDVGRSADGCLLSIPFVGVFFAFWLLVKRGYKMGCLWSTLLFPIQLMDTLITCFFLAGIEGENRYGEPPK